jgi:predicted membrane protein
MDNLEKIPEKKSVVILVILSYITLGIYPFIWYIKRSKELNNLNTQAKLKKLISVIPLSLYILIIIFAIAGAYLIYSNPTQYSSQVSSISQIPIEILIISSIILVFGLLLFIFILALGFKTRKILNQALINKGEKVKISGFYTFFFNFLYLQYEINRIIDDKENNKRRGPLIWFIILYILPVLISLVTIILAILGI